jgi:3-hydroxyisobutyrate dehydrogenase-like beta-hydroxyacid dehydrogenase
MTLRAVGLLSPGDMGHVVGRVLITHGMPVLTCLEGRSERTRMLARKAGIKAVPNYEDLVRETDMILSILVPGEAENAARTVARALRGAGEAILYVDCNAISPATSQKIEEIITGAGSKYVDASIIGPPPRREGTTKFYASGQDVEAFEALADFGLDVRRLGSEIGLGKGIKMAYGALTKGLTAISTQLLIAAWRMGLFDALVALFEDTQAEQYRRMRRAVPSMPHRSRRWVSEMEEISRTFEALGMTPQIYQGIAELYRFVGSTSLADETAETMDPNRSLRQVIELLGDNQA